MGSRYFVGLSTYLCSHEEVHMMQTFRAPRSYCAVLPSPSPATCLMWLVGCALLLCAANTYAQHVNLMWDSVSVDNLRGYRLYYGQTAHTYTASIDVGLQTDATVSGLTASQTYYF